MSQNPSHTESKVYVFIDAANLWEVQKSKAQFFDYGKLKTFLATHFQASSLEVFYYTAYPANGTRQYDINAKHRFFTFLKKALHFHVKKKELKRIKITDSEGECIKEKGNMDVEITIDSIHYMSQYEIAVFFTGDADFLALINYLKKANKKVYIFSSENNVSQELRTGADGYFELLDIKSDIWGMSMKYRKEER